MYQIKIKTLIQTAILIVVAVFCISCSQDSNPISVESNTTDFGNPFQNNPYPVITQEQLRAGPAPGFCFLEIPAANGLDDNNGDTLTAIHNCQASRAAQITIGNLVSLTFTAGDIPYNMTVAIIAPLGRMPVADFYPHPTQFNGNIEITWDMHHMDFPSNFDYSTLIPFYVDDNGNYIEMPYQWLSGHDRLQVITNHFSRYVIGQRLG